jgi:hypothetical protein
VPLDLFASMWNGFCLPPGQGRRRKSRVEVEIDAQQAEVAALFADPYNNPRWMDEIERIEPISGEPGLPGSVYRMVPAEGTFRFVATVMKRVLPNEVQLSLDAEQVSVLATDTFVRTSDRTTKLISEEIFTFKGRLRMLFGLLARRSISAAHQTHMEWFKRFAESHSGRSPSRPSANGR